MSGLSFKFSKTSEKKVLKDSRIRDESTKDKTEETDFVKTIEDKDIKGTKKLEEKKELVIPLIVKNNWRKSAEAKAKSDGQPVDDSKGSELTLEQKAAQEILQETAQHLENWESRDENGEKKIDEVPMLTSNAVPEGYETEENLDVSLRAEESTLDDYENVPIEQYGIAMLRGMGWKPGDGIGGFKKEVVNSIDPVVRPKGLGLGASIKKQGHQTKAKEGEEDLSLKKGAFVVVDGGNKNGQYGEVQGLDEENGRVIIKLALGGASTSVYENIVRVVTKKEYKENGKVVNLDKYEKYKKEREEKEEKRKRRSRSRDKESGRHRESATHKRRTRSRSHSRDSSPSYKKSKNGDSGARKKERTWVRPHLRVRCIDSKLKDGRYYNTKMIVVDVPSSGQCDCRTDEGKLLQSINTSKLETVIPRQLGTYVMVVLGDMKGEVGSLMDKDKSKCKAVVKLDSGDVVTLDYDAVCDYTGDTWD